MVFNVNNNGDPFKLPKIKIDLSQGLFGAENPNTVFGDQNFKENSPFAVDFSLLNIQKEETDTTISYTRNGIKTTFFKRENSDIPASVKYESVYFEDIKSYQIFYDETGKPTRREEIFKDDNELATKEVTYDKKNPDKPVYQIEKFKEGHEYLTRETFYDKNGKLIVRINCANGDVIIQKPTEKDFNKPEVIIPKGSFGLKDANIYIKGSKGERINAGNIFKNNYGIMLDDLNLPKLDELSEEELRDFPEDKLIIKEEKNPYGVVSQEIGCYKNGKFVSFALNKEGNVEEKVYSIGEAKDDLKLEHSKYGAVTTEYIYHGDSVIAQSMTNGAPFYSITTDSKGNKIKTYAYEKKPFCRTRYDKNGNEITEFYNQIKNKWTKEYPAQPVFVSYTAHSVFGKSEVLLDRLKTIPSGTKVKIQVNISSIPNDVNIRIYDAKYVEIPDADGNQKGYFVHEYTCKGSGEKCIDVYEVLPDFSAGRRLYTGSAKSNNY